MLHTIKHHQHTENKNGETNPNLSKTDLSKSSMTISASIEELTEPIGVPNFCL